MPIVSARMTQDEHETGEDGEYKSYGTQLALHVSRIGLILVSLVWGVFLLINAIPTIGQKEAITKLGAQRLNTIASDGLLKVSFPSVRNGTFQPIFQSIHWVSGREHAANDNGLFVTFTNDAYFVKSVYDESFYKVLHKGKAFTFEGNSYVIDLYQASPSLTSALVRTNTVKNWRHSTFGSYFIISTVTGEVQHIGDNISVALWSPNSDKVAFVHDNDLYLYYVETANVERISHDGSDIIFNGRTDWVYEEEIYENDIATWWSPSGTHIAYLKINEDKVHEYPLTYFVQEEEKPYPEVRRIRYPKSGTPNPLVSLNIYDVSTGRLSVVDFSDNSFIVTEVKWVGEREVLAKMTDRTSDRLSVVMASAENDVVSTPRIELSEDGWWEVTHNTLYIPKSIAAGRADDGYIDVVTSEGYNHLGYFSPPSNSTATLLTQGEWEVVDGALAFDAVTDRVYFFATKKDTTERHLYYVTLSEPLKVVEVTDTSTPGVYSASFSGGSRFILLSYNGPDIPYQKLIDLRSTQGDDEVHGNVIGETLYYLQENTKLKKNLEKYSISRPSFRELDLGTDERGQDIIVNSYEILPPDFNPSLQNHYPVFFYAYGGPNSQLVQKRFGVGFFHVIAAELDAIVVVVDGRGTGLKGKDFRSVVRGNLGDLEAEDQIRAARIYRSKSFVNKDKISIFGWSYGGYLTLKTLEKDAGATFKYGMAVAPVTDWRLYDTIYTERYMLTPQINPQGYAKSKVHNATALAQAKRFLLMHGTGDDNVHFQHSLRLLDMLNLAGVENYDVHVFPDSDHSIRYHNADVIIYDRLLSWARQAFDGNFVRHLY